MAAGQQSEDESVPVPFAHLLLLTVAVLPLFYVIDSGVNVVLLACLCVYVGCWRSVKPLPPVDAMTKKDALKFPLIGSAVLLGLFLVFKLLPKELINRILTFYFMSLGALACTATILPFVTVLVPFRRRGNVFEWKKFSVPYFMKEPTDIATSIPEIISALLSLAFCCWYQWEKHWLANNILGLAFSIQGIEHLSLGAVQTGVILLSGLFFYDIFWVFFTPVMVSVATSVDAPIKLLFPRPVDPLSINPKPFSMLGLGDIVIPGIFVALILRYDAKLKFTSHYFRSAFASYGLGLTATILVMNWFSAAQPALLYIVPAVLGGVGLHALLKHEFKLLFDHAEDEAPSEDKDDKDSKAKQGAVSTLEQRPASPQRATKKGA
ncbi:hypothetical protein WJX73_002663 [Symbiochloris irregularis]|uniref:Signal peptide peptidase n=1 Tax=Symbiochloris irregularis TaxID=706552 RepID=A0AAW1NR26_9CHLO